MPQYRLTVATSHERVDYDADEPCDLGQTLEVNGATLRVVGLEFSGSPMCVSGVLCEAVAA